LSAHTCNQIRRITRGPHVASFKANERQIMDRTHRGVRDGHAMMREVKPVSVSV